MTTLSDLTAPAAPVTDVSTWDVRTDQLAAAIKAVLPHVEKDKLLPVLCGVNLTLGDDGQLWAQATDRYTMARSRIELNTPAAGGPPLSVTITAADAKALMKFAEQQAAFLPVLPLDIGADTLSAGIDSARMTVTLIDGDYPKVGRLIPGDDQLAPMTGLNVAPDYLARFALRHLARDRHEKSLALRLDFTRNGGPLRVGFSDHFEGVVMTRRRIEENR